MHARALTRPASATTGRPRTSTRSSASPRTPRPTRSRRPTASSRAPTTPTPTPATPPSTTRSRRSPRPTTSSATPTSARSTTRCAPVGAGFGGFGAAAGGGAASTSTTCCASAAAGAAAASATCSATSSAAARRRTRTQANRPTKGADVETTRHHRLHRRDRGRHDLAAADLRRRLPDLHGHRRQAGHQAAHLPGVRGRRLRASRRSAARSRSTRPAPRCGGRQLVYDEPCPTCHGSGRGLSGAHDPGAHPRRGQGRPADPAARQGRGRASTAARPATSTSPSRSSPHRLFGRKGDNLHPRRAGLLRRGRARRGHQGPHARRGAGHPQDPGRARPTAAPSGSAARAPARPTAPWATCSPPSRCRCRRTLDATAREAVEAYRAATAGKPLRANLFEAA